MFKSFLKVFLPGLLIGLLLIVSGELNAQNSREIEVRKAPPPQQVEVKKVSKRKAKKQLEKTYAAYFDRLIVEYEERMQDNVKRYNKLAKELRKPQYSDPSYFGHKKAPRKRAVGKKRKCKECHMWH